MQGIRKEKPERAANKGKATGGKGLDEAKALFCSLVARGDMTVADCLRQAFPKYRGKPSNTVKSQAKRLAARPEVVREVARLRESFAARVEDRYAGLKEEMVDRMVRGIREGTDGDPLTVVEFVPAIKQLSAMLGWNAPTDVTVRNGGVAEDYRPPTLTSMTDEEISAKLAEMRGA